MPKERYVEVNCNGVLEYSAHGKRARRAVAVANCAGAVIRTAKPDKNVKLNAEAKWQLVSENFPLGSAMDEKSHIFDGCVYENEHGRVYLMAALDINLAQITALQAAQYISGSHGISNSQAAKIITRVEALECLLFSQMFEKGARGVAWLAYPCEGGIKILATENGLPECVHFVPMGSEAVLTAAINRAWEELAPDNITFLHREDWEERQAEERLQFTEIIKKIAPGQVIKTRAFEAFLR